VNPPTTYNMGSFRIPANIASSRPINSAEYSATLFVQSNTNLNDNETTSPSGDMKTNTRFFRILRQISFSPFSYQLYILFFLETHQKTSPSKRLLLRILPHLAVIQILKNLMILDFPPINQRGAVVFRFSLSSLEDNHLFTQ